MDDLATGVPLMKTAHVADVWASFSERTGLPPDLFDEITVLAKRHGLQSVVLFGSRARGTFQRASDIDLACMGGNVRAFAVDVDDTTRTPLKYDVIDLDEVSNEDLKENVRREGIEICQRIQSVRLEPACTADGTDA